MNRLSLLFKHDAKTALGRWNVDYCQQTLHTKILMANEDHCGTCGSSSVNALDAAKRKQQVRQLKRTTDAMRRYNEYINAAVKGRKPVPTDLEKQIEYYICMH